MLSLLPRNRSFNMVQHGSVSSKYFGERHLWPSHLQADLAAACRKDTNYPWIQRRATIRTNLLLSLAMFLKSFCRCFGASSGMERPSLAKLPIKESVVKLLPSDSSLHCLYYLTRFARSSFIKCMCLTCDG